MKLFATCAGNSFDERRDSALMRVMLDTGARLAEVTNLKWSPDTEKTARMTMPQVRPTPAAHR